MTRYILSIGLNVGDAEPPAQLSFTLRAVEVHFGPILDVAMGESEWQGQPERFVQVVVEAPGRPFLASRAKTLAAALNQEAIASIAPGGTQWDLWTPSEWRTGASIYEFPILPTVIINPKE